jgi:ATP synthase protein I
MTSEPKGPQGHGPDGGQDGLQPGSFDDRLRAARTRHGLDRPAADAATARGSGDPSAMSIGVRVGVELVSALAVAVAIGLGLDHWLHTSPALLVVFVLLGGAAGVANVWRLMGPKAPRR